MTVTIVTGANSGIGRAAAIRCAVAGHTVYGTMRDLSKGDKLASMAEAAGVQVHPVTMDVTNDESVANAISGIIADAGRVDALVNNAGIGWNATVEDIDIDAAKLCMETNYWGLIRCTKAVLPTMRRQGSGVIVNISSIAGRIAALAQVVYSSSKWAVESLSEGLAQEVASFGIRVAVVEPGVTMTAILPKNPDHPQPTVYQDHYNRMLEFYAAGIAAAVPADDVANVIVEAIDSDDPQFRYQVAWGGDELVAGRAALSDAEWVDLGNLVTDAGAYQARFNENFGLVVEPFE